MDKLILNKEYRNWVLEIKNKISSAQIKSVLAANRGLILFYYELGETIVRKQEEMKWGNKVIDQLSEDLQNEFPGVSGFSRTNLYYIRQFYLYFNNLDLSNPIIPRAGGQLDSAFIPQSDGQIALTGILDIVTQIPWGHIKVIMSKVKDSRETVFYLHKVLENSWSRDTLALQIKTRLYDRTGKAVSNFKITLPHPFSDLAQQTLKDPYIFDFMTMSQPYKERDIENQLIKHITRFLLELGKGFAFIGQQYHLSIADNDYYLDLLFYHTRLKCYVVIELKNTKFIPEYAGKLNFYLSAVDTLVKQPDDNPTIGILLCRDKNNIEAEFALRDINKPMGVSEFEITEILPENLKSSLPTIEELENELLKEESF